MVFLTDRAHAEFQLITAATSERWVWRTAFGSPVVPELNG